MIRSSISCLFRQIRSLRFLTVLIIWILIVEDIVSVYRGYVVEQGLRDSIVILPFLQTNAYFMKIIRLAGLCFYSNAPFMEREEMFALQRMGRGRWGMKNILYLLWSSLFLTILLNVICMIADLPAASLTNEWGSVLRTMSVDGAAFGGVFAVDSAILNQFSPLQVLVIQFLLDFAAFYVLGLLLYVVGLFSRRIIAYIVAIAVLFLPSVIGWLNYAGLYFSPFSWIEMTNWRVGYDLSKPDFIYMAAGFLLIILVLVLAGQLRVAKVEWNNQEE